MEMKTATLVRQMPVSNPSEHIVGVYKMSPPHEGNEYVYCSSSNRNMAYLSVKETYLFASDGEEVTDWRELQGSQRDVLSHKEVFQDIGYTTINPLC